MYVGMEKSLKGRDEPGPEPETLGVRVRSMRRWWKDVYGTMRMKDDQKYQ